MAGAQVQVKYVQTKRGHQSLVHNGYSASVEDVWLNALERINEADIDINTTPFCDYVTEYWVENNRDIWNHFENEGPRTTNHLEGWHNKLKKQVRCTHPNIFNLLKLLKQIQAANEVSMIQYAAGGVRATKRRKFRSIDERIVQLKERL
ncbi:hypothetical protein KUTeg_017793 [Tegillarca granosa]|uniref:Transposase n=1 Tax=Tegillarca granosa TaxID=220873 RepID=A0ABQ9EKY3_TEGGR|nr:hypothetical protein KUTeg_017793 [Tegillarca granosa]